MSHGIFPNGLDGKAPRSSGDKVLVCPHCRSSRTLPSGTISVICGNCNKYFRAEDSLPESEAVTSVDVVFGPMDPDRKRFREDMEKKAYDYRDKVNQKRKDGTRRSHEPGGKSRNW